MTTGARSILELGHIIQTYIESIHNRLVESNLPQPPFADGVSTTEYVWPESIQNCRAELLEAVDELRALILGPTSQIYYTATLSVSTHFEFEDSQI